jgi:peptidoglycan/LPS O-acetylase OafA/YrhL
VNEIQGQSRIVAVDDRPSLAPRANHERFPLLDSVRGLALLAIIAFHVLFYSDTLLNTWWGRVVGTHLAIGVPLFFALSGFLLFRPFISERSGGTRPGIGGYAYRRALRILPAYWVMITLLAAQNGLRYPVFGDDWWIYYGLLGNYAPLYDPIALCGVPLCSGIYWTLGTEASFYMLLPLLVLGVEYVTRGMSLRRWAWTLSGLLGAGALMSTAFFAHVASRPDRLWQTYTLPAYALLFLAGMAVAVASVALERSPQSRSRTLLERYSSLAWIGAAVVYAVMCWSLSREDMLTARGAVANYVLNSIFVVLFLVPAIFDGGGCSIVRRVLATRFLQWIGAVSYGAYLCHIFVLEALVGDTAIRATMWSSARGFLALFAITVAGSLAIGAVSYYALERPILALRPQHWRRHVREAAS